MVTIAPHLIAQSTIDGMSELTAGLSVADGGLEYMVAATNRHARVVE
jgi:hypothetical protein